MRWSNPFDPLEHLWKKTLKSNLPNNSKSIILMLLTLAMIWGTYEAFQFMEKIVFWLAAWTGHPVQ
jgi:hypothetical protein